MNKVLIAVGTFGVTVIIFLVFMVFNLQQQINDLR